ncbi:LOG family protein [Actinacidiphila acidipaludis]|uniref:LOG family protein n=1 Tax=Actinacidiphila acidipaludis TaxID=2873382 RepID=A0ABS7Q8L9_9ACTN|nr:LOG family protein [Streptomyces acidipaludis]MBY8879477.1 LOG family protein [Streptomyces acidipaludis]
MPSDDVDHDPSTEAGGIPIREIQSLEEFDQAALSGSLAGCRIQALDLTERTFALLVVDSSQAVFLGCPMEPQALAHIRAGGALVFPPVPDLPFDPYRGAPYTPDELYAGLETEGYAGTPDARTYAWYRRTGHNGDVLASMLRSVHDDALSDALDEMLRGSRVVGVMGGHAMERGSRAYAGAARLGRDLARSGLTVATGGGPGAMEAANFGAYAAPYDDVMLGKALEVLARVPSFGPSVDDWAAAAMAVRDRWPDGGPSYGLPTWFYGHEPANPFAAHIAKYFANATREDGLLSRCNAGVVFLPGAAGTVQEVFDAATTNYYGSRGEPAPMVLVDRAHWTTELPVWPLLTRLAGERPMADRIALVESVTEVPAALARLAWG